MGNTHELDKNIKDNYLFLRSGTAVPIVSSALTDQTRKNRMMPVKKGYVGSFEVNVLRDTGCSTAVIKQDFVSQDQYTGDSTYLITIDSSVKKVPVVKVYVNTPYYTGWLKAACLKDAIYDLIIGNIPNARDPMNPDTEWEDAGAVTTRAQAKRENIKKSTLQVPEVTECTGVTKEKLIEMQYNDKALNRLRLLTNEKSKGQQTVKFEEKAGILYRVFTHPHVNQGMPLKQIVVPVTIRNQLMQVAHNSIIGGHLGMKKTTDKLLSNFYWPGIYIDVKQWLKL